MRPGCPVRRPKGSKANPEYLVLWRAVTQARGQAQLRAEIQALNDRLTATRSPRAAMTP
jgi:hypothetical protein